MTEDRTAVSRRTILTLRLEGEVFALPVDHVQEIIDPLPMIHVPCASALAPGLVNVRGSVAPVLDLRRRLGMPPAPRTENSRFIVLDVPLDGETTRIAVEADAVDKVVEVEASAFEPIPEIGIDWPAEYLDGVARLGGDLVVLLKAETVFAHGTAHAT